MIILINLKGDPWGRGSDEEPVNTPCEADLAPILNCIKFRNWSGWWMASEERARTQEAKLRGL